MTCQWKRKENTGPNMYLLFREYLTVQLVLAYTEVKAPNYTRWCLFPDDCGQDYYVSE